MPLGVLRIISKKSPAGGRIWAGYTLACKLNRRMPKERRNPRVEMTRVLEATRIDILATLRPSSYRPIECQ